MRIRSEETTTSLSSAFNGTQMFFVFDLLHLSGETFSSFSILVKDMKSKINQVS
ncbi:hypothetical protein F2Q70_00001658 [Brassica cretica]|uniref:Uncharacterized protein n=1 Tax=Brassica cretica TaxID=69181 RepID=A0A8S9J2A2_BRACR|nr:hypothetical protein F2Q70_00001658 [Brassica cretica]